MEKITKENEIVTINENKDKINIQNKKYFIKILNRMSFFF